MDKTTAAVLVDYDYYKQNEFIQDFVQYNTHKATMVALVTNPDAQDPDDDENEYEWGIVIRNTKGHPDEVFKLAAVNALSNYSNIYPALAIDLFNEEMYDEAGVLLTLDGKFFG